MFIEAERQNFSIPLLCRVMRVSKAGYYKWKRAGETQAEKANRNASALIVKAYNASRQTYGRRRIYHTLRKWGVEISLNRVGRLMKRLGLYGYGRPKTKRTTIPSRVDASPNLAGSMGHPERENKLWVSDITYVPTQQGWLYVCTIMDAFSRKIVGWSMQGHLRAELVLDSLKSALRSRKPGVGLTFHSDRGSQYKSHFVRKMLRAAGVRQSMSSTGNCYDNAQAESFFASLKKELIHRCRFSTREEAKAATFEYLEVFYNKLRLHSALGYLTPSEFEATQT